MQLPVVRTTIQTRYSDTNGDGHIANEAFVTYTSVGREAFLNKVAEQAGFKRSTVVANLNLDYLSEIHYGQNVEVVTWCSHIGTKSMKISNEIYADGELVAKATVVSVGVNSQTRVAEPVPENWQISDY